MLELKKRKGNLSLVGCLQAARNGGGSLSIDLKRTRDPNLRLSEEKMITNEWMVEQIMVQILQRTKQD